MVNVVLVVPAILADYRFVMAAGLGPVSEREEYADLYGPLRI